MLLCLLLVETQTTKMLQRSSLLQRLLQLAQIQQNHAAVIQLALNVLLIQMQLALAAIQQKKLNNFNSFWKIEKVGFFPAFSINLIGETVYLWSYCNITRIDSLYKRLGFVKCRNYVRKDMIPSYLIRHTTFY